MKTLFAAASLALGSIALAACSGGTADAPAETEANPTGLEITNARLILPPVAGNPAAVYFDIANKGAKNMAVRSADVADAKSAMMHDMMEYGREMTMAEMGPLMLRPGESAKFEPGGKHVMAFDLSPDMKPGAKTELTLTVAGGDKVSAEVTVEAANAAR